MAVNNEIGVIQPLKEIGAICRENGVYFHTDAAQAFGKIPLDVEEMNIDMMSISGHKIYGPKGIGALYIRRKPRVRILPMIHGGGQERGFRSGTLPTPIVAGLGEAARIAKNEMEGEYVRITGFYNQLKASILDGTEAVFLNGDPVVRYYGNLNISFGYIEGESMIMAIKDIAVSSGSACTSASLEASYVLKALGVQEDLAHTSIRFGIGRFTTQEQIDYVITRLKSEIDNLRNLSPLWEMYKEGIDISKIQWAGEHHSGNKMSDFDKVICGVN
jgi:cysteine desulfurase